VEVLDKQDSQDKPVIYEQTSFVKMTIIEKEPENKDTTIPN